MKIATEKVPVWSTGWRDLAERNRAAVVSAATPFVALTVDPTGTPTVSPLSGTSIAIPPPPPAPTRWPLLAPCGSVIVTVPLTTLKAAVSPAWGALARLVVPAGRRRWGDDR